VYNRGVLLYKTPLGPVVLHEDQYHPVEAASWDALLNADDLPALLDAAVAIDNPVPPPTTALPPIGTQEVWAAGVTYWRSRTARLEESRQAGGGSFYDRVYEAERPELFFKATAHRVVGPGARMRLRRDSRWIVPEPELVLVVNRRGKIIGYTAGNDLSCRDIEGENPLYLPQAKVFDGCAALGPAVLVTRTPLAPETEIRLAITRAGAEVFAGHTTLAEIKRPLPSLVEFLFREASFPAGVFLFTGTGIVPPDDFSLQADDEVRITIPPIGTLVNIMG
jgi:2-dehydro-3-deoxy-D-arabinonate dehydratase